MESSGFYFQLEPPLLMVAVGIHCFSKRLLAHYRESVVHEKHGPALVKAIKRVSRKIDYSVGGKHYKKTPRGFDPDHENAELLRYNGLWAAVETEIPESLHSKEIVSDCLAKFKHMAPLHAWLVEMTGRIDK